MNEKMMAAIEKKFNVKVEKEYEVKVLENNTIEVSVGYGGFDGMTVTLKESKNQYGTYYKVVDRRDFLITGEKALEIVRERKEKETEGEMDEAEALANIAAAQELSKTKNSVVWVMSNGKRTAVIKTESNKSRHEKYGYWTAAIFQSGLRAEA